MHATDTDRLGEAAEIARGFAIPRPLDTLQTLGSGLINHTFLVGAGSQRWVLQRVNEDVFRQPDRIMENLARLSERLVRQPLVGLRLPGLIPAADGARWVRGEDGGLWRLMELIAGGRALTRIAGTGQAEELGQALGRFHAYLDGLAPGDMMVTLPGFHVTPAYIARFLQAWDRLGGRQRDEGLYAAAAFVTARRDGAGALEDARRGRRIPERIIHGDPKLDNFLFDEPGRRVLALIDLDTVQPGLVHYDIGDCLRSCCNRGGESGGDPSRVSFDLEICAALLAGYARSMGHRLPPAEIALIYDAVRIIPLELGVRFLTDHLEGDRWFRVSGHGDNLVRARTQFALVADIEHKADAIRAIIGDAFRRP